MPERWYYVCDSCGTMYVQDAQVPEHPDSDWECDDCGSNAAWEFTDRRNAEGHSEHIKRLVSSGLVRRRRG